MSDGANPMEQMLAGMLKSLEGQKMDGLALDDLKAAMSHPEAAKVIAESMPIEAASVQQGQAAPDFTLNYLPGSGPDGESVTLSSHFGSRPVALIFGSYT